MRADRFVDEFNSTWLMGWHDECADLVPDMPAGSLLKALQGVHPGNRLANKQVLEQIKLALTKTSQDVHRFVLACERKLSYPVDALPFIAWRQAMLEDHLKGVLAQNPKETGWQEAAVDVFLGPEGGPTAQALGSRMAALARAKPMKDIENEAVGLAAKTRCAPVLVACQEAISTLVERGKMGSNLAHDFLNHWTPWFDLEARRMESCLKVCVQSGLDVNRLQTQDSFQTMAHLLAISRKSNEQVNAALIALLNVGVDPEFGGTCDVTANEVAAMYRSDHFPEWQAIVHAHRARHTVDGVMQKLGLSP